VHDFLQTGWCGFDWCSLHPFLVVSWQHWYLSAATTQPVKTCKNIFFWLRYWFLLVLEVWPWRRIQQWGQKPCSESCCEISAKSSPLSAWECTGLPAGAYKTYTDQSTYFINRLNWTFSFKNKRYIFTSHLFFNARSSWIRICHHTRSNWHCAVLSTLKTSIVASILSTSPA